MNALSPENCEKAAPCASGESAAGSPLDATPTGLAVSATPTRDAWEAFGDSIRRATSGHHWVIGDWVLLGEHTFGADLPIADLTGLDEATLRGARYVASRFELVRRRTNLSFAHHREVASLPPDQADALLDRAESESLSVRALRALSAPRKPTPARDQETELLRGSLRDLTSIRTRIGRYLTPERRAELEHVIAEVQSRLTGRTAPAQPADDERATDEDLKGGRYGRRV